MATTVCIEMSDDGQYNVGIEPPESDMGMAEGDPAEMEQDKSYMQPAQDIDEALDIARQLLSGGDQRSPEQAMMDGYNKGPKSIGKSATPEAVFGE